MSTCLRESPCPWRRQWAHFYFPSRIQAPSSLTYLKKQSRQLSDGFQDTAILKTHERRVLSRHSQSHQHPARKKLHFPTRLSLINPPGYLTDVLTFDAPSDGVKDGETEDQTQRAEEFIRCRHSKEKKKTRKPKLLLGILREYLEGPVWSPTRTWRYRKLSFWDSECSPNIVLSKQVACR